MEFLAIILAAAAGMAVGFVWFGPLFGKMWTKLMGFTQADMEKAQAEGMNKTYLRAFLVTLLMAWILNVLLSQFTSSTPEALRFGLLAWLALIVPSMANQVIWEGKNKKLFYINIFERLATILVMCAILSAF